MATTKWTDAENRTWSARLTIGEAQRLRTEEGIDLLDAEALKRLVSDPLTVVRLICSVHAPQYEEAGLTVGDFAEICTSTEEVASAAADAMVEALADFFGRLRKPALAQVIRLALDAANSAERQATMKVHDRGRKKMDEAIARAMDELDAALAMPDVP